MATKIVKLEESVLIGGAHFEKGQLVNCDETDADQLISIKRARIATDAEVAEAKAKAKPTADMSKPKPTAIGEGEGEGDGEEAEGKKKKKTT
jgi:hypothetical protein